MAADSRANSIMAYVVSQLGTMPTDGTFWYVPARVARVEAPRLEYLERALEESALRNVDGLCVYMVYRGPLVDQTATTGTRDKSIEFHVIACRRLTGERARGQDPDGDLMAVAPVTPTGETIRDRMELDVEKRLCGGDLTMGGRVIELHVPDRNREIVVEGWDCVQVMFLANYRHQRGQP